jgi:hypothetical protein
MPSFARKKSLQMALSCDTVSEFAYPSVTRCLETRQRESG